MNNLDALRISEQRDDICEWAVARFRELMEEDRIDDAICFADEWFEWLDPNNYENEETMFYDEQELLTLYMSMEEDD
jgi:hypothetical protein